MSSFAEIDSENFSFLTNSSDMTLILNVNDGCLVPLKNLPQVLRINVVIIPPIIQIIIFIFVCLIQILSFAVP